ncbi:MULTISPECIES: PhzF family phenazine biosynthesis protein [unclassified Bacillus (in: firmicutes)]|uniref:PhzF family phenazine biosynthesis protein n=1 Tax=unclassified Bacillus (in: firmicutes) TaxID=185979 RepID=UPI001BEB4310|nr:MULTISPECIES: PhzF family phenazine biosynthesis protein [unclassified Bacillus (in: firmicutes)]MBT2720859.1 PhzF family phenazine biosynthesis protein [Bacillus sp. ISL-46]MBT2742295.1 PhzF family phenazine biosynthesis protein [Bacillus sp. ISL-77]
MKQIPVYHIDAFTDVSFGGNPAGVIPDAKNLREEDMKKIANELNLPESVFLMASSHPHADFKVKYFTPLEEINFCGHATIGLSWLLGTKYNWLNKADQIVFETNVGLIPVKWIKENNQLISVSMTQIAPKVKEIEINKDTLAQLVGIQTTDLDERYPIKLSNTGNWHLLVPVKTRKAIDLAEPQLKELGSMNREHNISTTHLFTFDTNGEFDIYTRDFAPGIGINEDPVTGAANGALAGYLFLEGFLSKKQPHQLKIGQGHAIGRPGTLYITIHSENNEPIIDVAGTAVITIEGNINIL